MDKKEFILAHFKKRTAGFIIDDLVISFLLLVIFYEQLLNISSVEGLRVFSNNNFMLIISLKILYHTFFTFQNGKTLGKHIMKIKVIQINSNSTPSLDIAFFRAVLRIFSELFFYIGFIFASFSPMVQTFHDKFTGCIVIDD
jgi:uncharacterized RDD family membrane protein YckC